MRQAEKTSLEELLKFLDGPKAMPPSFPIGGKNWTEDDAKTEFGWRTVLPMDVAKDNQTIDQETVYSDEFKTRLDNGQGLA